MLISGGILFAAALYGCGTPGNVLRNSGFEDEGGGSAPFWQEWGEGGAYALVQDPDGRGGKCLRIDGQDGFQMVYQWTDGAKPGAWYRARLKARAVSGVAHGGIKMEFMDESGEKSNQYYGFPLGESWRDVSFKWIAPDDARKAALTLMAGKGESVLYDDAELVGGCMAMKNEIVFDLNRRANTVHGFGVHHWADLRASANEFKNLNITHIRVMKDWSSWKDMKELRAKTESLGIKWLFGKWSPDKPFMGKDGNLEDVNGFSRKWVETVKELDEHDCRPHFIDLSNEPDYFGIPRREYAALVKAVRRGLDAAGFADVGIAGPGLTHIGDANFTRYLAALDDEAVRGVEVWATHAWEDVWSDLSGDVSIMDSRAGHFVSQCRERDAAKPIWFTEYATRQIRFHGVRYPHPDNESDNYNASYTMIYAVRVYENTLAILNRGANIPFYWCSGDYKGSKKQWGYIGPEGERKPIWYTLKALYGEIPPGARVIEAAAHDSAQPLYAAVFADEREPDSPRFIVGLANSSTKRRTAVVRLAHAPVPLKLTKSVGVELASAGSLEQKIGDTAMFVSKSVPVKTRNGACEFKVTLPATSTLTLVLAPGP